MGQLARRLFEAYWKSLMVPARHQHLDSARVDGRVWTLVLGSITSLFTTEPHGLFLTGPVGTGKTALLWLIRAEYAKQMATVYATDKEIRADAEREAASQAPIEDQIELYYCYRMGVFQIQTHGELIQDLRNSVKENGGLDRTGALFNPKTILLLDDLGRGYDDKGGWHLSLQDEYFDWRWKNNLPTYVTTNLTAKQLREWPGWTRIIDRLVDPAWMRSCTVGGGSRRRAEFYAKEKP